MGKEDIINKAKLGFENFYYKNIYLLDSQDYRPGKKVYRNMSSINKIMNLFIESNKEYLDKQYIIREYSWEGSSTYVQHERVITNFNLSEIPWKERRRPCIILNYNGIKLLEKYKKYIKDKPNVDLMDEKNYTIPDFAINYIIKVLKETTIEDMSLWKNCLMTTLFLGIDLGYIPKYRTINKKIALANNNEKESIKKCCGYINKAGELMDLSYFEQVVAMLVDLKLVEIDRSTSMEDTRIVKYYLNNKAYKLLNDMKIFEEYEQLNVVDSLDDDNVVGDFKLVNKEIIEVEPPLKPRRKKNIKARINSKGIKRNYEKENKKKANIGKIGELLILEYERKKLERYNVENIDDKLVWVSQKNGDGVGYDILSYDVENDREIYIEVKATEKEKDEAFFITSSELKLSKEKECQYYLYRIYGLNNTSEHIKFYKINGDISNHFDLEPIQYLVR
ncbi:DUF3883 domain-containing protein [Clostridium botulinum]|uniref:DUF3883 domain-containing protein n=1 Tax=Clostridium botulinum TaxID=1491 RepID=UPI0022457691|nr:DUF3883 domain-containing protein [Clostridium botulinum]UZP04703.1 DUF3883 domain-containing protein [Clostridium botulinum]UZP08115.1 DUF3883 domain-containing protein [Clostridium botulinum]UZP11442.1 DUF3883 domain-containing protein [Clostridium botulinum]